MKSTQNTHNIQNHTQNTHQKTMNSSRIYTDNMSTSQESIGTDSQHVYKPTRDLKRLIKQVESVVDAEKILCEKRRKLSKTLLQFNIGMEEKSENIEMISGSLKEFGRFINEVEEERERMFENAVETFINPLKKLVTDIEINSNRNKKIGNKTMIRLSKNYPMFSEHLSNEENINQKLRNRDSKNLEFIEFIESLMKSWLTFYHVAHDRGEDLQPFLADLRLKMQQQRHLADMKKQRHLADMEKQTHLVDMEPPMNFNSPQNKILRRNSDSSEFQRSRLRLSLPVRKISADVSKRKSSFISRTNSFTGRVISLKPHLEMRTSLDCQGEDFISKSPHLEMRTSLDYTGSQFISKCLAAIEARGLCSVGLYRVGGVNSKVNKLLNIGLDKLNKIPLNLEEGGEWSVNTITTAVKKYFRSLDFPLLPQSLHSPLFASSHLEPAHEVVEELRRLISQLPSNHRQMLKLLLNHLAKVARRSAENQMTPHNLGVCFGPALMRIEGEGGNVVKENRMANVVVQNMIQNHKTIFQLKNEE